MSLSPVTSFMWKPSWFSMLFIQDTIAIRDTNFNHTHTSMDKAACIHITSLSDELHVRAAVPEQDMILTFIGFSDNTSPETSPW